MKISVIVTTYNRIDALSLVLQSLAAQDDGNFEIIVADDGSREETGRFVADFAGKCPIPVRHVWQEDRGFRAGRVRNLAAAAATGAYLIYLDGDCITQPDFVRSHRRLAEPGFTVTGSRILMEKALSAELCQGGIWNFTDFRRRAWRHRLEGQINKFLPLFLRPPGQNWRRYQDFVWRRIKSCNLACWKADVAAIGGFGDDMEGGWGHEDADLVFRLHVHGVRRKSGTYATEVLHLWHKMAGREKTEGNRRLLQAKIDAWRAGGGR